MTAYNPDKGVARKYMREQLRDKSKMIDKRKKDRKTY